MVTEYPADRWLIIEDNLSIHTSHQTRLALVAWPGIRFQFIPKYACWLNLIEPWWKQLRSLALKGRRSETLDELTEALNADISDLVEKKVTVCYASLVSLQEQLNRERNYSHYLWLKLNNKGVFDSKDGKLFKGDKRKIVGYD